MNSGVRSALEAAWKEWKQVRARETAIAMDEEGGRLVDRIHQRRARVFRKHLDGLQLEMRL